MSKNYKPIRFPIEAYNNLLDKQKKMSEEASRLLGKQIKIPFTKIITIMSRNPLFLDDKSLIALIKKRKGTVFK